MSIPTYYIKCTKCDFRGKVKQYFNIEIRPKEGVQESKIEFHYCERCEAQTKWFMGKGEDDLPFDIKFGNKFVHDCFKAFKLSEIKEVLAQMEEEHKKLEQNILRLSRNFVLRLLYYFKLRSIMNEKNHLDSGIIRVKEAIKKSAKNIMFYQDLDAKPRCLECGYDILYDKPKHSCGGEITIEQNSWRVNPSMDTVHVYEYDELGNVSKTFVGNLLDSHLINSFIQYE